MRILQVSTADIRGGAEKIAWDLFRRYRALGHESWLAVGYKQSSDPDVFQIPNDAERGWWTRIWMSGDPYLKDAEAGNRSAWLLRRLLASIGDPLRALARMRGLEDFRFPGTGRLLSLTPKPPQIVHCHNLHGSYFDLRWLPRIASGKPVILTMHDAWLTTGHCAHSFDCERWTTGCGECPDLTIYPRVERDLTAFNIKVKRNIIAESRVALAAPSQWLMDRVERSLLSGAAVATRVIPAGIDLDNFKPGDRSRARTELGLPLEAQILLFAAAKVKTNPWKDHRTIEATLRQIAETYRGRQLVFLALGEDAQTERFGSVELRYVPFTRDPARLTMFYQATDLYVHAALVDTFPNTVLEAMACGIPVVASAVGGIPEQVVHESTGLLVPPQDPQAMAAALDRLLADSNMRARMGQQAAERARRLFDLRRQAQAYLDYYEEIIEHFATSGRREEIPSTRADL